MGPRILYFKRLPLVVLLPSHVWELLRRLSLEQQDQLQDTSLWREWAGWVAGEGCLRPEEYKDIFTYLHILPGQLCPPWGEGRYWLCHFWSSKCNWIIWASCLWEQLKTQHCMRSLVFLLIAHLICCFHFAGCCVLRFILSFFRTISSSPFSVDLFFLDYWLWFTLFLLLYYGLLVSTASLALGQEILSPWDREHKYSMISMWVELRGNSNLVWMWAWDTSPQDVFS